MIELIGAALKADVIDQIQTIYRLYQGVVLALVQLADDGLRGIQDDALPELVAPVKLHLDNERSPERILAPYIDHAVLLCRILGHHLWRGILQTSDLGILVQRQQGVQQALRQVGMLAEYQFKRQVCLRVQILTFHRCHSF